MEYLGFVNLSPVQYFEGIDFDRDDIEEDLSLASSSSIRVQSESLKIHPNIPKYSSKEADRTIVKLPVLLSRFILPFNISSSIHLPVKISQIQDIETRLRLEECILIQPTYLLFIKGSIQQNIKYTTSNTWTDCQGNKKIYYSTVDLPFKSSSEIDLSTRAVETRARKKTVIQDKEEDNATFSQVTESFLNEAPFCQLLSSKITELNQYSSPSQAEKESTEINQTMLIELEIEVLQRQEIVIPS